MVDPLAEIITLLRPRTVFSKLISGAGRWGVRYSSFGQPSFCTVLEGRCLLAVEGHDPLPIARVTLAPKGGMPLKVLEVNAFK